MNLVLIYSLSLSVLIALSSAYESPFYEEAALECAPANCGTVKDIRFPFWVEKEQPAYCGYPSFRLSCKNQTLVLTNHFLLQVKNIFYENRSVLVADETFAGLTHTCGFEHWSPLYFDQMIFNISHANKKLIFLYNCSKPPSNYYKINCNSSAHTTYAVWDTDLRYPDMCSSVVANTSVAGYMGGNISNYLGAVNYGFLLDWSATQCEDCKKSYGQCGYDETYNGFMCICPDRNVHYKSCPRDYLLVNPAVNPEKKKKLGAAIGVVSGLGGALLLGTCIVIFICVRRKRKMKTNSSNLVSRTASSKLFFKMNPGAAETCYNTHTFSYDELEKATHGFHESRELGHGGFGTVYKGTLRDGRTVAVKRLHQRNCCLEQFTNEVKILSRLRHQNLVTLYGCTSRQSRELLLVYEYIPNGTLADHLHGPLTSKPGLPWPTRMSIIIQTAEALSYLHSVEPQIIHRDIKTNNILLDNNFQVKVADFGISRLFPLDATHVSTRPQGTFGYLDPEYYLRFQLTDKSDVYSFGVVLIELISSMRPVDTRRNSNEISLAIMAITKIRSCRIGELVDPDLGYEDDLEIREMIDQVARLAFRCLLSDAEMRPGIKEVLSVLKHIKGEVDADGVGCDQTKGESTLLSDVEVFSSDYVTGR